MTLVDIIFPSAAGAAALLPAAEEVARGVMHFLFERKEIVGSEDLGVKAPGLDASARGDSITGWVHTHTEQNN